MSKFLKGAKGKMSNSNKTVHPAAKLFPLMTADKLKALADDIKANGLIDPILIYQDQILDGRNREAACRIAGVEPRYALAELNGHSPTLFVVAKNLHRRHLTIAQRAAVAANMLPMLRDEAKERQRQAGKQYGHDRKSLPAKLPEAISANASNEIQNEVRGESRHIAAQAMDVGARTVQTANYVKTHAPEIFEQVLTGDLSLPAAEKITEAKREGKDPKPGTRQESVSPRFANAAKKRMVDILSNARGMCRGLAQLKTEWIATVLEAEEKKIWTGMSKEISKHFREFAHNLENAK